MVEDCNEHQRPVSEGYLDSDAWDDDAWDYVIHYFFGADTRLRSIQSLGRAEGDVQRIEVVIEADERPPYPCGEGVIRATLTFKAGEGWPESVEVVRPDGTFGNTNSGITDRSDDVKVLLRNVTALLLQRAVEASDAP